MIITSLHTKACFDAWIKCENLLAELAQAGASFSKKLTKVVDECAYICMGTFHALKSSSQNINKFALLCMGICEECAELCETMDKEEFQECAKICRQCSDSMTTLTTSQYN